MVRYAIALISMLPVLAGGCSKFTSPTIELGEATLVDATEEAVRIEVNVSLTNTNDVPIELRTFEYSATVNSSPVFQGLRSAEATLPAHGTTSLVLPVIVRRDTVDITEDSTDVRYGISGSLIYVTPGALAELLLDTGVRRPTVRFNGSGGVSR